MADDRRTGITGDQIEDNTISKDELIVVNDPPSDKMVLGWDAVNAKFKWYYASDLATRLDHYQEDEGISSTTLATWVDKLIYTSPSLIAGHYEFWFYAEINKTNNQGATQRVRLIVDNVEYCFNAADANVGEWKSTKGFKRFQFLTAGTHTVVVQYSSGTAGKSMDIRRTRIRVTSVGIE